MTDPLISPVYGDFDGFPPTYLVSGTRDMFLSNTVRTHRKLRSAGVEADLNVYESLSHGEYLAVIDSPESRKPLHNSVRFYQYTSEPVSKVSKTQLCAHQPPRTLAQLPHREPELGRLGGVRGGPGTFETDSQEIAIRIPVGFAKKALRAAT